MTLTLNLRDAELDLLLLMIMLKSSLFFRPPNLERTIRGIYMYQLYIGSILNYHTRQIYAGEIPVVNINAKAGDTRTCGIRALKLGQRSRARLQLLCTLRRKAWNYIALLTRSRWSGHARAHRATDHTLQRDRLTRGLSSDRFCGALDTRVRSCVLFFESGLL